ncbi:TPA: hypothetical protein ACF899_001817, partial [Staphylococcus aureus]
VETAGLFFLCLKRQNKSKHKERWLGEVKTFESDETRKERNEFSRARGKKQAIVTSQERSLATMVANLRSARVERCQAS